MSDVLWKPFGLRAMLCTIGLWACVETSPEAPLETSAQSRSLGPIIGGQIEQGWPAVGALTMDLFFYGYSGSFCTGALIGSEWVLTAAHCLSGSDGVTPTTRNTLFYFGGDARPTVNGQRPSEGLFVRVDRFYVFPGFNGKTFENDIGLLHLAAPVPNVQPLAVNASALGGFTLGRNVFYVGFGATEGVNHEGSGVKRSASIGIEAVYRNVYIGGYDTVKQTGICFGDSGGPGLLECGDGWRIVGVNSGVGGPDTGEPCKGVYFHTRVDRYAAWIADVTSMPPPNCQDDPSVCACAEACQADGSCNPEACQTLTCAGFVACLNGCPEDDSACTTDCQLRATDQAGEEFRQLIMCGSEHCEAIESDEDYNACLNEHCEAELDTCFPETTGAWSCREVATCIEGCEDGACAYECYGQGTGEAQELYGAMVECFNTECAEVEGEDWSNCAVEKCSDQVNACYGFDGCPLTGGGCADGEACYALPTGATNCYASDGLGAGQSCQEDPASEQLACADGLTCVGAEEAQVCRKMCLSDADCADATTCVNPVFAGHPEIGTCAE